MYNTYPMYMYTPWHFFPKMNGVPYWMGNTWCAKPHNTDLTRTLLSGRCECWFCASETQYRSAEFNWVWLYSRVLTGQFGGQLLSIFICNPLSQYLGKLQQGMAATCMYSTGGCYLAGLVACPDMLRNCCSRSMMSMFLVEDWGHHWAWHSI